MIAGARVDVAPYKKDATDFVLWKPSKPGEPSWPSPAGIKAEGRPGWHIECSAMAWKHLGEQFDIHGGGIDLVFPHHENEVAQTCCAFHRERMANYWMHNGFLQVESEKMSKCARQLRHHPRAARGLAGRGAAPEHAEDALHLADRLDHEVAGGERQDAQRLVSLCGRRRAGKAGGVRGRALLDDLNTPLAIAALHGLRNSDRCGRLLPRRCVCSASCPRASRNGRAASSRRAASTPSEIDRLIAERTAARARKDFKESDRIRDELAAKGVVIKDGKDADGKPVTTWELA